VLVISRRYVMTLVGSRDAGIVMCSIGWQSRLLILICVHPQPFWYSSLSCTFLHPAGFWGFWRVRGFSEFLEVPQRVLASNSISNIRIRIYCPSILELCSNLSQWYQLIIRKAHGLLCEPRVWSDYGQLIQDQDQLRVMLRERWGDAGCDVTLHCQLCLVVWYTNDMSDVITSICSEIGITHQDSQQLLGMPRNWQKFCQVHEFPYWSKFYSSAIISANSCIFIFIFYGHFLIIYLLPMVHSFRGECKEYSLTATCIAHIPLCSFLFCMFFYLHTNHTYECTQLFYNRKGSWFILVQK